MQKKAVSVILAAAVTAGILSGCGGNKQAGDGSTGSTSLAASEIASEGTTIASGEGGEIRLTDIDVDEYVTLPDLDGMEVEVQPEDEVTDEDVQEQIDQYVQYDVTYDEVKDRDTVEAGDVVNITINAKVDGEEVTALGYTDYDYDTTQASNFDGLGDALAGHKKGEEFNETLKVAQDYFDSTYAGKDAACTITVNEIEEAKTPEFNDEYVKGLGLTDDDGKDITTVEGAKEYFRQQLEEQAESDYDYVVEDALSAKLIEMAEWKKDLPESLITQEKNDLMEIYELDPDSDDYDEEEIESAAETNAKTLVVYQAAADQLGISVNESDVSEFISSMGSTGTASDALIRYVAAYQLETNVLAELADRAKIITADSSDAATGASAAAAENEE